MKFGLWFEPEMVSPDSDLYELTRIGVFMSQIVIDPQLEHTDTGLF